MKKAFYCILCLLLCLCAIPVPAEQTGLNQSASYAILIDDLVRAYLTPSAEAIADAEEDRKEISNAVGDTLTSTWERLWIYNTCPLYLYGTDDPAELPITGRHAFVILGYQLQNGNSATTQIPIQCFTLCAAHSIITGKCLLHGLHQVC